MYGSATTNTGTDGSMETTRSGTFLIAEASGNDCATTHCRAWDSLLPSTDQDGEHTSEEVSTANHKEIIPIASNIYRETMGFFYSFLPKDLEFEYYACTLITVILWCSMLFPGAAPLH